VLLSTHLLEEVEQFLGRALLLHRGARWATFPCRRWWRREKNLMSYVKETYRYRAERVGRALADLTDEVSGEDRP
jgi:ABC-2 type transport system ATP-binding protein